MRKIKGIIGLAAVLAFGLSAQAALILNTGQGALTTVDAYWDLTSVSPPGAPNGGETIPNTYVIANHGNWLANDANSKWISYQTPRFDGGDPINRDYTYTLSFYTTGGDINIRWASDNTSTLFLDNGPLLATHSVNTFSSWANYTFLNVPAGNHEIDIVVKNLAQNSGNPTGLRAELAVPVPEPATMLAGALLLLPFGASTLRRFRRA